MKSPFPGMDPYLEQHWRDVHASLIIYAREQLGAQLPSDLRCRVEERVVVEPEEGPPRNIYPDVRVVERSRPTGGVATLEPPTQLAFGESIRIPMANEQATETFLEIIDIASGKKIVTVIEILSLTNKLPGPGREQYRKKQEEIRGSDVSLVEIDLLRAGERVQLVDETLVPREKRTPYRACVRRGWMPGECEYFPIPLRAPLPAIRVPLRERDAEIRLELQPLIDRCYQVGGFDDIDYSVAPVPPLDADDAAWTRELLERTSNL